MKLADELKNCGDLQSVKNKIENKADLITIVLLWVVALVVNVKHILFSFGADEAYTVVMGWRMIRGDRLFLDMWEPHQTSAFLTMVLEKLYLILFGTTDGIIIWLHIWGMLMFGGVAFLIIRVLKPYVPVRLLHFMAVFYAIMRPKNVNMPSYANLSVLLATVMWLFLVKFILEKKRWALIIATVAAAAATFAYPSNLLLVIPAAVIVLVFSDRKWRDLLIAVAIYAGIFVGFAGIVMLAYKMSIGELAAALKNMVSSESHYDTLYKGWAYFKSFVYCLVYIGVLYGIATAVRFISRKKADVLRVTAGLLLVITPVITMVIYKKFRYNLLVLEWIYYYLSILMFAMIAGAIYYFRSKQDARQKVIYLTGTVIGISVVVNTCILTNLPLITVMAYTSLPVICAFIPIYNAQRQEEKPRVFLQKSTFAMLCVIGVVAFQQMFIAGDQGGNIGSLFGEEQLITVGPEKGMGSIVAYCDRVAVGRDEWISQVSDEDSVLLAWNKPYLLTAYMYTDARISTFSTISTPDFDLDRLHDYWSQYPDRYPTVIVAACYDGTELYWLPEPLKELIDAEYERSYTGKYWNFYRRKNQ